MSPLRLIILLIAAGAAIAAVFLVRSISAPVKADAAAPIAAPEDTGLKILIAKKPLRLGQFIAPGDLGWQEWPENAPRDSFITRQDVPQADGDHIGAVVRVAMAAGEPVTAVKLVKPGDAGFMAAVLTPGMRAVSISVTPESASGGFIMPNDRVDVLLSREVELEEEGQNRTIFPSDVIFENVRVLAIDTVYDATAPATKEEAKTRVGRAIIGKRATLELSRRDAELLEVADRMGRISLLLRSVGEMEGDSGATWAGESLDGGSDQTSAARIRVFRNGSETRVSASPN
ncbi:Flp pilus assembly protein CpaB [bacterium]|nr:Flp pilus assembly protein CpaB [bacterium]